MSADGLERLLQKLCSGDAAAAEEVFRAYEPYLRMVIRRHLPTRLRPKFDSMDIVQSIWADLLVGFREAGWRFTDADHLRAFLVRAAHNRFIDRYRQHQSSLEHEQALREAREDAQPTSPEPRPSEVARANELWDQILALCPPRHQEVFRLKREGCSLDAIAERVGLHKSSVRRIIYDLERRLAAPCREVGLPRPAGPFECELGPET